jgi:hypothetical protein
METAGDATFRGRRRYRLRRRRFTLHAEVESATTAVIAVARQGDEGFLVAEQLTQKMGHDRLPVSLPTVEANQDQGNALLSAAVMVLRRRPSADATRRHLCRSPSFRGGQHRLQRWPRDARCDHLEPTPLVRCRIQYPRRRLPHCASCRFTCWRRLGQQHHQCKGR